MQVKTQKSKDRGKFKTHRAGGAGHHRKNVAARVRAGERVKRNHRKEDRIKMD